MKKGKIGVWDLYAAAALLMLKGHKGGHEAHVEEACDYANAMMRARAEKYSETGTAWASPVQRPTMVDAVGYGGGGGAGRGRVK